MAVAFHSHRTSFQLAHSKKIASWILRVVKKEKKHLDSVSYIFCTDAYLSSLNRKYLNHSTLTDIITFDYSESERIVGEIYISIPRIRENSKKFNSSFKDELDRVIIHGILHLIGYSDKNSLERSEMRKKEDACLSLR